MQNEKEELQELAYVSRCIQEAKEVILMQQGRIDRASSAGLPTYEESGRLIIMVEALDAMTKRRAQLLKKP